MFALNGLQSALDAGAVQLRPCDLHPQMKMMMDEPTGKPRFTYALVDGGKVQAVALFALVDPNEGLNCFKVGFAVLEKLRGKGVASRILQQSIDELRNGLGRTPMKEFYVEAIVSTGNDASNAICRKILSASPSSCVDAFSKEPALQYLRKFTSAV